MSHDSRQVANKLGILMINALVPKDNLTLLQCEAEEMQHGLKFLDRNMQRNGWPFKSPINTRM
jgi:hypothetical protein